jgi:hypothetical protein
METQDGGKKAVDLSSFEILVVAPPRRTGFNPQVQFLRLRRS